MLIQMCVASNACTPHRLRASGVIESVAKALRNCSATRRKLEQFGSHLGPASWSWRWFLAAASRALYYPTLLAPPCCALRLPARRVVALMSCACYRIMFNACLRKHRCVIPPKTSSEIEIQVYFVVPKV